MAEARAEVVDASEDAQIAAISKTFDDVRAEALEDIRHPDAKRKHLRVVETYDILPDSDAWANSYIMIKFPERPSAATVANPGATASKPRLERAILRPVMEDDQQIMEYFLPKEDDLGQLNTLETTPLDAADVEKLRSFNPEEHEDDIDTVFPVSPVIEERMADVKNVGYERIRTYEVVMQAQPQKEVLLTFVEEKKDGEDEEDMFGDEEPAKKKRKGVYYKDITMRTQLRKTRAKRSGEMDARSDMWDKLRVAFRDPESEETEDRDARGKPVNDPRWTKDQLRDIRGDA